MYDIPQYQCHKKVMALKIVAIEFAENGSAKLVSSKDIVYVDVTDYRSKFKGDENDLGYWIKYDDGYTSWSPTKAFEEGYKLI